MWCWLIILHYIPKTKSYEYNDAIEMRNDLHKNLKGASGNVLEAFESRPMELFKQVCNIKCVLQDACV